MSQNPIRSTDDEARELARALLSAMRHATLGVTDEATGHPHLTRIACQIAPDGVPVALLAGIAAHSRALRNDPRAGLLVETTLPKGDPMTWPRLSLQVAAEEHGIDAQTRALWLAADPKAKVYIDLPDFRLWRLRPLSAMLNGGFARAYRLTPEDLIAPPTITTP